MKSRLLEPTASAPEHDDDPRSESEVRMDFLILKRRVDDHVRSKARRNAYGYEDEVREYLDGIGKYPLLTKSEEVTLAKMIGLGTQSAALMAESGAGLNGFDEKQRRAALKRLAEAKQAKDIFIECNLRLVVSIAGNYKWSEMHLLDLVHAGNDGLNRAVEKFDARRGFKFSTYATWWIKQSIIREIESQVSPVRLPAHMMSRAASARKIMKEYTDAHGGITPTIDELAKLSGRSAEEIQEALTQHRRVHNIVPLDGPIGEDGETTLGDIIVSTDTPETDVMITNMASKAAVDEALRALNEREAQIISLRYLETEEPLTQAEVGARLGLKAEMVRRIERMAILKMRELLNPQRGEATYS